MTFSFSSSSILAASAVAVACALGSMGCASTARTANAVSTTTTTSAEVSSSAGLSDAQIASVVSLENASDLQRAQYGQAQAMSPNVHALAEDASRDDSGFSRELGSLLQQKAIDPALNPLTDRIAIENDAQSQELRSQTGVAFDHAFLIDEARSAQRFLDLIDGTLLPSTNDPDLHRMLGDVRAQTLSHRNAATRLLSQ